MSLSNGVYPFISRRNWSRVIPAIRQLARQSDFVSVDLEFTGLHAGSGIFKYGSPEESYEAYLDGVRTYLPVQLGFCFASRTSRLNQEKLGELSKNGLVVNSNKKAEVGSRPLSKWTLTPMSVYIYPRKPTGEGMDLKFSINAETMDFLIKHGFDCNEWVQQGIGWTRMSEETGAYRDLKARLAELEAIRNAPPGSAARTATRKTQPMEIPPGPDREAMDQVRIRINLWLGDSPKSDAELGSNGSSGSALSPSDAPLELELATPFLRLLCHSVINHEFPDLHCKTISRASEDGTIRKLLVVSRNRNEVHDEEITQTRAKLEALSGGRGVREILDIISESRIPLVGHNCFYDMMHLTHSFIDSTPKHLRDFRAKWHSVFPLMFDTRWIAEAPSSDGGFGSLGLQTSLGMLAKHFVQQGSAGSVAANSKNESAHSAVFSVANELEEYGFSCPYTVRETTAVDPPSRADAAAPLPSDEGRISTNMSHDAGYDAMQTAAVFAQMVNQTIHSRGMSLDSVSFGQNLQTGQKSQTPGAASQSTGPNIRDILDKLRNKVKMMRTTPGVLSLEQ